MNSVQHTQTPVFVVLNPSHRSARRARSELERQAAAAELELTVLTTTVADSGAAQARQALQAGARRIVACGGDGTVRRIAGLLAGTAVPLGVVPTGTANLFARNLGLRPRAVRANVATALTGAPRAFDVGWSRHRRGEEWSAEEPFLVVGGLGRDAATVLNTSTALKRRLKWLAYFWAGAGHLLRPPVPVDLAVDGQPARRVDAWCVLAGNCGRLPGGILVFPHARPDDGVLDTLVVPLQHPWEWAAVAAKGLLRLRRDVAALEYGRAAHGVTVLPSVPQPMHLDGDAVKGVEEARWRVAASALLVVAPARTR